jgi:hypothetical protein
MDNSVISSISASLALIFSPNAVAFFMSSVSGRPVAMGVSGASKLCSPMNAAAAMGLNPLGSEVLEFY